MAAQHLSNAGYDLYKHQQEGIAFMKNMELTHNRGGVLADEVGLGKTIQAIGLILEIPGHTLISGPEAVIPQWAEKLQQILPTDQFEIFIHHRDTCINNMQHILNELNLNNKKAIVITSHGKITRLNTIHQVQWERFILDEAHYARNSSTRLFKECINLKANFKWMLSATPVQNKISDLTSLFRIACKLDVKTLKPEGVKRLCEKFLLRRTKDEINLTLPPLTIENRICRFISNDEEMFYSKVEQNTKEAFQKIAKDDNRIVMFELLMRLRQSAIHPQMVIDGYKKKGMFRPDLPEWDVQPTKIHYLKHIIQKEMKEDPQQKNIIFCQFHLEINKITEMLTECGFTHAVYSGKTDYETRDAIVSGLLVPQFLIIQIRAGGAGLNLQQYNRVFITSPDWNPCNEFQAIGRAHRTGQTKPVKVTRLILHWSKQYVKKLKEEKKKIKKIEKQLEEDDKTYKLSIEERTKLENIVNNFQKRKPNTIDYRIFVTQKNKTEIQASILGDKTLLNTHKYDVQELDGLAKLTTSNYSYLLG